MQLCASESVKVINNISIVVIEHQNHESKTLLFLIWVCEYKLLIIH